MTLFNEAIKQCQTNNWVSVLGFLHELIAKHYVSLGLDMLATPMLQKSIRYYQQWGAYGKVKYLQHMYSHLLQNTAVNSQNDGVQTEDVIVGFTTNVTENNLWENTSDGTATDPSLREISSGNEESSIAAADLLDKPETTLFSLDMIDLTSIIKSSQGLITKFYRIFTHLFF